MPNGSVALSISFQYLEEIEKTVLIKQAYYDLIVKQAAVLHGAFNQDKNTKKIFEDALKLKTVDTSTLYKSLIVQVHGVFENYIRLVVQSVIEGRFEKVEKYSLLSEDFKKRYVDHVASILSYAKSGNIKGVSYPFDKLLKNFEHCLSDRKNFKLNHEIYTKLMGNCTSARLATLFESLLLPDPFGDQLGENPDLRSHLSEKTKGRVSQRAKEELDKQIDLRNDIVHGNLTLSVDENKLNQTLGFFKALISALDGLALDGLV